MRVLSHVIIGASAWALAAGEGLIGRDPRIAGLAVVGALLPDLDHPQSWLGRRLPFLSRPIAAVFGHRGITHSLLAVGAMIWLLSVNGRGDWLVTALALGYLSHLAADGLTPQGVPLLWPSRHRFALPLCQTGGFLEPVIVLAVAGLAVWRLLGR